MVSRIVVLIGIVITGTVALVWLGESLALQHGSLTSHTASSPFRQGTGDADPIYTSAEAIERTVAIFPSGHSPVARLISHVTFNAEWVPGDNLAGYNPTSGIWLVGVLADGMSAGEAVAQLQIPGSQGAQDPTVVDGVFVAWDANSGQLVSSGTLTQELPRTFASLSEMVDEPMQIVPATNVP